MNVSQRVLLNLVKQSQFDIVSQIPSSGVDWDEVYNEALSQSVLGLVAPFIASTLSEDKWQQAQYQQMANYYRYSYAEDELRSILNNECIPFVILKGSAAAMYYKDPTLRSMGDIDFLVPHEQFEETKEVLSSQGFTEEHANKRHVCYEKNGINYELHYIFSYEDKYIEDYILEDFNYREIGRVDSRDVPMLPQLANGLVLLEHMRRHLRSGLGLRQVVDWMMYVYRNLDDEFWESSFRSVAASKGLEVLAVTATRMCQIYLGLPLSFTWCSSADEKLCEELMECLLVSGNFGRKNGSGNSVETVSTSIRREGLFRWLQMAGEHNWAAYRNHHWLKPFCWIYQAFRYAGQGLKTGRKGKELLGDLDRSKERYELLKKLELS